MPWCRFNLLARVLALTGGLAVLLATGSHAQETAPAAAPAIEAESAVKTGKERLSDKASDEQRVDNCKVPPERQGTTPRPAACRPDAHAVPTN